MNEGLRGEGQVKGDGDGLCLRRPRITGNLQPVQVSGYDNSPVRCESVSTSCSTPKCRHLAMS
jgi:hypothetical protein